MRDESSVEGCRVAPATGSLTSSASCARGGLGRSKQTPEQQAYRNMIARCYYPRARGFENYGGRGITVCDRWRRNIIAFMNDVGPRPSDQHSIDRINPNGNYEPGNVRWATRSEQAQTMRITPRERGLRAAATMMRRRKAATSD